MLGSVWASYFGELAGVAVSSRPKSIAAGRRAKIGARVFGLCRRGTILLDLAYVARDSGNFVQPPEDRYEALKILFRHLPSLSSSTSADAKLNFEIGERATTATCSGTTNSNYWQHERQPH
ncbi:hypothetical protein Vi05172_g12095 [Venturia inaequalis]|nr:hypothetical protein Vi05172_g12095 [Venturia inaequalis]